MKTGIWILLLATFSTLSAQTTLLEKVKANYSSCKSFYVEVNFQLDMSSSYNGPAISSSGFVMKEGDKYYSQMMGITQLSTTEYQIALNDAEKVMVIKSKAPTDYFKQFNIETLSNKKLFDQNDFKFDNEKKTILITITPKTKSSYKEIQVRVDAKKYFLLEVHNYYNIQGNQVIASHIYYTNSTFNKRMDKSLFNMDKYVRIKENNEVILGSDFKKYKLINYLN